MLIKVLLFCNVTKERFMAHEDKQRILSNESNAQATEIKEKSIQEQLRSANKEIEDLKLQLAWLVCSYE